MSPFAKVLFVVALCTVGSGTDSYADKRTVCTITVNSPDEKEMFRQRLPEDQYEFVELVERGRPDWLASACQKGIRCDLLVISGHCDGSTAFYSDQVAVSEFLPVAEMERASCSDSCPGLFSQLESVRVQHVECRRDQEHVFGSQTKLCPRWAPAGRSGAPGAHARSAPCRKQPRSDASHFH